MRYFLLFLVIGVVAVVAIAGKRGSISRKPPLYMFPDMDRQLKLRPQEPNGFFANGISSQMPPPNTVARRAPLQVGNQLVQTYEDSAVWTGYVPGTTNYAAANPFPVTAQLLKRGEQRFMIFCSPCHGATADGNGVTKKIGAMPLVANLHDKRIIEQPDGEIFNVITHGRSTMGPYGPNIPAEDRWAIIAYLRALQLTKLGTVEDIPAGARGNLK